MSGISETTVISELVASHPEARQVLARFGIRWQDEDEVDLGGVARAQEAKLDELLAALNEIIEPSLMEAQPGRDWSQASASELIEYVIGRHHNYMRVHLPHIHELLDAAFSANDASHVTTLHLLRRTFDELRRGMDQHMYLEEEVIFPLVRQMELHRLGKGPRPEIEETLGGVDPFRQMEREHEDVGEAVERMRSLTGDFTCPAGAEGLLGELYGALAVLAEDMKEHVRLENDFLWPVRPRAPR